MSGVASQNYLDLSRHGRSNSSPAPGIIAVVFLILFLLPGSARSQYWIYTVRPGDTIWDLTEAYLSDMWYWRRLQALNKVTDPEHLPPGSRLRMPVAWLKLQPIPARVLGAWGDAEATVAATGQRLPVTAGLALRAGDEIHTGPDGSVTLEFGDSSHLLLQANSHLILDTLSAYGETSIVDTRLRLQRGRVDNQVTPQQRPSRYEIWTPAAITAVRGTRYRLQAEATSPLSRTEVLNGSVGVSGKGKTRFAPAQFGVVAKAGEPPAPPVRLLPPPDLAALPQLVDRLPVQFSFAELRGAAAYRAQIAPNAEFRTLLFDGAARLPPIRGPDLPDGDYVVRVRGIDARGLEGLDAYHRFTLNARPAPPVLVAPRHNAIVLDEPPAFQWSEPEKATGYHFQLADNEQFRQPLLDMSGYPEARFNPKQPLKTGSYYWRVATLDALDKGPFSDPQRFRLQSAVQADAPQIEDNAIVFRWSAGLPGQRYQLQLARDRGFEQIVVNTTVAEPQMQIAYPESGFYYLRIRTIDSDGSPAPYGPTQRVTVPPRSYWPYIIFTLVIVVLAL